MPPIAFSAFAAEVRTLYAPPLRRPTTRVKMNQVLNELESINVSTTADLTPSTVARYCALHAEQSTATLKGLLSYFRAVANLAVEWGYLERSPFGGRFRYVRKVRKSAKEKHHSAEQILSVLEHLELRRIDWRTHRLFALVSLYAFTGVRKCEALYLKVADIDHEEGLISIVPSNENPLKTEDSAAEIPAPALLLKTLAQWQRRCGSEWLFPRSDGAGPWLNGTGKGKPSEAVKEAGKALGIDGFHPLSLRHSFSSIAVTWGLSPLQIQQCLRHTNQRTQEAYRHAEIRELSRLMRDVSFRSKPEEPRWPNPSPQRRAR